MSMKIDILNMKGEKVGDYTIDDTCLEFDKGTQAVHDTVVGYLAELRRDSAVRAPAAPGIRSGVTAVTASVRSRATTVSS